MAKLNIKKGDTVVVLAGKDKGKTGKVIETVPTQGKTIVNGINIVTKHQKARNAKEKGGIVKKPAPIDNSNLMVICSTCGKATRVARKEVEGKHVRICKKCGASLDKAFVKAVKKDAKKKEAEEVKQEAKTEEVKAEAKTTAKKSTTAKTASTKTKATNEKVASKTTAKTTTTTRRVGNRGK